MTEMYFYHLDRFPLERVLPELLEKCIERRWHAVVQLGSEERCDALDAHLWTYRDDAFLPHGSARESGVSARAQPIWLTAGDENPNDAQVRFLADGAEPGSLDGYRRIVRLFDGNDPESVERARAAWKAAKADGHEATYWQQNERGGWTQKA